MNRTIAFSPPDIGQGEIDEVVDTLRSGWITTGPKTKRFEKELTDYCKTGRTVCLNSATDALELTLRLLGIGPGDEVITSAYTYTASASVVCHVGAKLVLVDTAPGSYEMDADALLRAITPKTKAIIPVDLGGVICDYRPIFAAVEDKQHMFHPANFMQEALGRVAVVADGAHALGACQKGKMCGQIADFTAFSFHAVKNLTTGEGGAVTWMDKPGIDSNALYQQFQLMSLHGQNKDALSKTKAGAWEYDIIAPYYKCNMTDIMASLGLAQLARYEKIVERRHEIIEQYNAWAEQKNLLYLKHRGSDFRSSGHLYLLRFPGRDEAYRNAFIEKMAQKGVATNVHYKPLPMHTAYKNLGFCIEDYPWAYRQFQNEMTLPLYSKLGHEDVEYVLEMLMDTWKEME